MRVLITGSSGYIGQHLLKVLERSNLPIDIDTLDYQSQRQDGYKIALPYLCWDIRHISKYNYGGVYSKSGDKYDAIIHLAAKVNVGESVYEPSIYYETNIQGTINVLNTFKTDNFIFASTGAAETPNSPYAYSKRCAEDVVSEICRKRYCKYTILRFYNVIGSTVVPPTNKDALFSRLIEATKTGIFLVNGTDWNTKDGTCVRDYVHIDDICLGIYAAMIQPTNNIENFGTGKPKTVLEIVDLFKKVNNVWFNVLPCPRRKGDIESSFLSNPSGLMAPLHTYEDMLKIPKE